MSRGSRPPDAQQANDHRQTSLAQAAAVLSLVDLLVYGMTPVLLISSGLGRLTLVIFGLQTLDGAPVFKLAEMVREPPDCARVCCGIARLIIAA